MAGGGFFPLCRCRASNDVRGTEKRWQQGRFGPTRHTVRSGPAGEGRGGGGGRNGHKHCRQKKKGEVQAQFLDRLPQTSQTTLRRLCGSGVTDTGGCPRVHRWPAGRVSSSPGGQQRRLPARRRESRLAGGRGHLGAAAPPPPSPITVCPDRSAAVRAGRPILRRVSAPAACTQHRLRAWHSSVRGTEVPLGGPARGGAVEYPWSTWTYVCMYVHASWRWREGKL